MSQCLFLLPDELEELLAAGWQLLSGPHDTEGECTSACVGTACIADCDDDETKEMPEQLPVTVSGLADGTCTDCTDLNTTYTLLWDGPNSSINPDGPCSWSAPVPNSGCGSDIGRMRLTVSGGVPTLTMPIGANGAIEATLQGSWTTPGVNTFEIAEELLGGYCTGTVTIEVTVPTCGQGSEGASCAEATEASLDTEYGPFDLELGQSIWLKYPASLTGDHQASVPFSDPGIGCIVQLWLGPDCDNLTEGSSVTPTVGPGVACTFDDPTGTSMWVEIRGPLTFSITLSAGSCS